MIQMIQMKPMIPMIQMIQVIQINGASSHKIDYVAQGLDIINLKDY